MWVNIDFRDLSKPDPKDDFIVPNGVALDAITGYEALSFIDGYLEYNQIKIHPKDN